MIGFFPSSQNVVAVLLQREIGSPVLQRNPRAGNRNPRAEGGIVALNVGHHIALAVCGTQVDSAAAGGVPRLREQGPICD